MFQPIKRVVMGVAALAVLALGGSAIAGAATSTGAGAPVRSPTT